MQRYHAAEKCSWPVADGEYVLHSDAQAEIERLTAEVIAAEQQGYAKAMEAERILYDGSLEIVRNDVLEEAAQLVGCMADAAYDGGLSHHGQAEVTMNAIRALKNEPKP